MKQPYLLKSIPITQPYPYHNLQNDHTQVGQSFFCSSRNLVQTIERSNSISSSSFPLLRLSISGSKVLFRLFLCMSVYQISTTISLQLPFLPIKSIPITQCYLLDKHTYQMNIGIYEMTIGLFEKTYTYEKAIHLKRPHRIKAYL